MSVNHLTQVSTFTTHQWNVGFGYFVKPNDSPRRLLHTSPYCSDCLGGRIIPENRDFEDSGASRSAILSNNFTISVTFPKY
jgi:hypothetical protein